MENLGFTYITEFVQLYFNQGKEKTTKKLTALNLWSLSVGYFHQDNDPRNKNPRRQENLPAFESTLPELLPVSVFLLSLSV